MFDRFKAECMHYEDGYCALAKIDCSEEDCQRDYDLELFKKRDALDSKYDAMLHEKLDKEAMS